MKTLLLNLAALVAFAFAPAAMAADTAGAREFVDTVAQKVLAISSDSSLNASGKTAKIEALFSDKVDIDFVAKFALGKHWRTATEAQRSAYVNAYKPFILKNYAGRLARYSGQTYTLKTPRADGDASIVPMEINDPNGQNIFVDYRLSGTGKNFKITDIVVEGVSMLSTQRSEFNAIVDKKGVDGLIDALKSQVAARS